MSTPPEDPFSRPAPVLSTFPDASSFRGRLIFIEPTKIEHDVPKSSNQPAGPRGDRITATVTVIDGSETTSPVELFSQRVPTGKYLTGRSFKGVWFNQDRVLAGLMDDTQPTGLAKMVLGRLETYKPGQIPGQGNPWSIEDPTEADVTTARAFLAAKYAAQAAAAVSSATPAATPAAGGADNPFSGKPVEIVGEAPF